jgi:hypothetical protein
MARCALTAPGTAVAHDQQARSHTGSADRRAEFRARIRRLLLGHRLQDAAPGVAGRLEQEHAEPERGRQRGIAGPAPRGREDRQVQAAVRIPGPGLPGRPDDRDQLG